MVVGKFNTIYWTNNGGVDWNRINIPDYDKFSFNKVIHTDINKAIVVGTNGILIELVYLNGSWIAKKRKISKYLDYDDEYLLVDDINDISKFIYSSSNGTGNIYPIVTNDNGVIFWPEMNIISNNDNQFIFFNSNINFGNIRSISKRFDSDEIFLNGDGGLYKIDFGYVINGSTFSNNVYGTASLISSKWSNKIFLNEKIFLAGNMGMLDSIEFGSMTHSNLDSTFGDNLKSKL